jgi:phage tail-like protein
MNPPVTETLYPIPLFRFHVEFEQVSPTGEGRGHRASICQGAFSECTGLEATMEPKVIKAGGANYGAFQRPGQVAFATVILKRGITTSRDLWTWFSHVNERGKFAYRFNVTITVFGECQSAPPPGEAKRDARPSWEPRLTVRLFRALPVKFKCGDLSARATEVGIEELHLAHDGLAFS